MKIKLWKQKVSLMLSTMLIASLSLINFSPSATVYASDIKGPNKQTINEYQALKDLNEEYNKNEQDGLLEKSKFATMPNETINAIKNYKDVYSDKIKGLQTLSKEQLEFFNYTDSQIEAINSFDGSEEMIMLAASTCDVYGDFNSFNPSSRGTTAQLIMAFRWNGVQSNWFDDIFAVAWSSPLNPTSLSGYVEYKNASYESMTYNHTPIADSLYGSYIKFPKYKNISGKEPFYVSGGSMILNLKSNGYVADVTGFAKYGYTSITLTGAGVSFPGSLSISFSNGVTTMDSHRCSR